MCKHSMSSKGVLLKVILEGTEQWDESGLYPKKHILHALSCKLCKLCKYVNTTYMHVSAFL